MFDAGERTGSKMNAQQMVEIVKNERNDDGTRRFSKDILLNWRQIQSFISSYTQKKEREGYKKGQMLNIDIDKEMDDNEGDPEIAFQDDSEILDDLDSIRQNFS